MNDKNISNEQFLYNVALETRNFEIKLFWQRSNYFLVLNTAIAIGFFKLDDVFYGILLSFLGFLTSLLWFSVNLGSKFWQSRWEERLKLTEEKFAPDIKFFSADRSIVKKDVKESLEYSEHNKIRKIIDWLILLKPSVSFTMILLSMLFILFWITVLIVSIIRCVTTN